MLKHANNSLIAESLMDGAPGIAPLNTEIITTREHRNSSYTAIRKAVNQRTNRIDEIQNTKRFQNGFLSPHPETPSASSDQSVNVAALFRGGFTPYTAKAIQVIQGNQIIFVIR